MHIDRIHALAASLIEARRTLVPVARVPDLTKADAALVKEEVMRLLSENGRRQLLGYKVSLSYTWGALFEGYVMPSPATIERSSLFEPLIETEAVFRLDAPIAGDMTIAEVLARCRVSAGVEIADSRFEDWFPGDRERLVMPRPADTEADNAFASCVVIGPAAIPASVLPLPAVNVAARRDGVCIAQGSLDYVMGHPANAVLWLARELEASGRQLRPGQFVFTGNPYEKFVTLAKHEQGRFDAIVDGVGVATANFV